VSGIHRGSEFIRDERGTNGELFAEASHMNVRPQGLARQWAESPVHRIIHDKRGSHGELILAVSPVKLL